jgi:DUF2948 family protein
VSDRLKLQARDREDFTVVGAVLQDALIALGDMEFFPAERQFVVVANRFRWENCSDTPAVGTNADFTGPCQSYERVHCGMRFDGVEQVRTRNLDLKDRGRILELLTFEFDGSAVTLVFAGGGAVRLDGAAIVCQLQDVDEPWPTMWRPHHAVDEGGQA